MDHIRFDYFIGSLRNAKVATATIRPDGFKDGDMTTYRQQLIVAVARLPGVISASFVGIEIPVGEQIESAIHLRNELSHLEFAPITPAYAGPLSVTAELINAMFDSVPFEAQTLTSQP